MEKKEILSKLQDIFRDILDDENIVLENETTADDIEGWDSLSHIQIVHEIESEFVIKFTAYEISSWIDIEELIDCIAKKIA